MMNKNELINKFIEVMSVECGKPIEAMMSGTAILYHSTDRCIVGCTTVDDFVEKYLVG